MGTKDTFKNLGKSLLADLSKSAGIQTNEKKLENKALEEAIKPWKDHQNELKERFVRTKKFFDVQFDDNNRILKTNDLSGIALFRSSDFFVEYEKLESVEVIEQDSIVKDKNGNKGIEKVGKILLTVDDEQDPAHVFVHDVDLYIKLVKIIDQNSKNDKTVDSKMTTSEKIQVLKDAKELLDNGVITSEEFEKIKKESL